MLANNQMQLTKPAPWQVLGAVFAADLGVLRTEVAGGGRGVGQRQGSLARAVVGDAKEREAWIQSQGTEADPRITAL